MSFRSRFQHLIFICLLWTILTISFHNSGVSRLIQIKESQSCPLTSPLLSKTACLYINYLDLIVSSTIFLVGWTNISNWMEDCDKQKLVELGGSYKPVDCNPNQAIALVVPYRNRDHQLNIFLCYIHPFLQRQQLDYTIFVVEQTGDN